jgi:hypothetical protein
MSDKTSAAARKLSDSESDLVLGAAAIGEVIDRTPAQVYHLLSTGALDGAASKLAHKTIIANRRSLLNLPFRKSK